MAQFIPFEPHVEVLGAALSSMTVGMGDAVLPILKAHGVGNLDPDAWYPMDAWLSAFKDIAEGKTNAMFNLVSIGMAIPENAVFPPQIDSLVAALQSIDIAYHMNHRGGEIGNYHATVANDRQVDFVCWNPYPCDFDYGIIYGMARRFCPPNISFRVRHDDHAECRKKGADSCTYHVTWEARRT